MILYPAIDIQGGKVVRLRRGDFVQSTVFSEDPVEMARHWEALGAEAMHVIDLDGARTGELVNFSLVEAITAAVPMTHQRRALWAMRSTASSDRTPPPN